MPAAREALQGVHLAKQRLPLLLLLPLLEVVLEPLLADHHQTKLLRELDQGGEVHQELRTVDHLVDVRYGARRRTAITSTRWKLYLAPKSGCCCLRFSSSKDTLNTELPKLVPEGLAW